MPPDHASAWDGLAGAHHAGAALPVDLARLGPDPGPELRLLGDVRGKRVLELGCGAAPCSIAFARQGATTIAIEASAELLASARRRCEQEEAKVELRLADLADLAFLRADSIDAAFSADAFGTVEDLGRVFRQVHRVLKVGAPLVFSLPHPVARMVDLDDPQAPLVVRRSYFDRSPVGPSGDRPGATAHHHTLSDLYTGLLRASYRVEAIVEPEPAPAGPRGRQWPEALSHVPRTLVFKARKEGS